MLAKIRSNKNDWKRTAAGNVYTQNARQQMPTTIISTALLAHCCCTNSPYSGPGQNVQGTEKLQ